MGEHKPHVSDLSVCTETANTVQQMDGPGNKDPELYRTTAGRLKQQFKAPCLRHRTCRSLLAFTGVFWQWRAAQSSEGIGGAGTGSVSPCYKQLLPCVRGASPKRATALSGVQLGWEPPASLPARSAGSRSHPPVAIPSKSESTRMGFLFSAGTGG